MNLMNKFQVIIPTKNSYKILNKLIDSIKKQTYKNWSVIFIDGKSRKEHKDWLKEFCKKDTRFFYSEQKETNLGIFGAMNQGLQFIEKYSWVLFLGSDDWIIEPNTFEELNVKLKDFSSKNLDLVICKGKYFRLNKSFYKDCLFTNKFKDMEINLKTYKKLLFQGLTPPHQATLMHSSIFSSEYKYDDNFMLAGDLNFFCRLCKKNKLSIFLLDFFIVSMSCGGISSKNHLRRFLEVKKSYINLFGKLFFIPFFNRYLLKLFRLK